MVNDNSNRRIPNNKPTHTLSLTHATNSLEPLLLPLTTAVIASDGTGWREMGCVGPCRDADD